MEKPVVFGAAENLLGVVNVPDEMRSQTAVIMLTAGMLHHVGSFRFHVLLARELERLGLLSFRFDLSGIGESLATGAAGCSLNRARQETGEAIDRLTADYGIENVILFGLCSGADDGWHVAKYDQRVIGLAMLDGLGFSTPTHQRVAWLEKARRVTWPSYWGARLRRRKSERTGETKGLPLGADIREFPSRATAVQDLQQFVDRGLKILACYTGGARDYYNYDGQFADMFFEVSLPRTIEHDFFPELDHVTLLKEDRQRILHRLVSWIDKAALKLHAQTVG